LQRKIKCNARIKKEAIKIEKRGSIGIDESNHGRFPEIYVGVFSSLSFDAKRGYYNKKRTDANIGDILNNHGRIYRHTIITKEHKELYGAHGSKIIAVAELIKAFNNIEDINVDSIILDGEFRKIDRLNLERILYPLDLPNFSAEPKADETFPIINKADAIANILHRYYSTNKDRNRYKKTKIEIGIGKYLNFKNLFE